MTVKKRFHKTAGMFTVSGQRRTLHIGPGPFVPLGHKKVPPSLTKTLGPPRFTEADQAANPDKPMTRLIKDILHVGRWRTGIDPQTGKRVFWDVTHQTLNDLAKNFRLATSRGNAFNLTTSHGDVQTGIVETEDLITPIDDVFSDSGVLWAAVYVTPEQAKFLQNPAMKVSVGVWEGWTDGAGNEYKQALIHVAVTDHPVVNGQGPFMKLGNKQFKRLAMDFPALLELINSMLPGNVALPDDTTEDNVVERLSLVLTTLNGGAGETPVPEGGGEADTGNTAPTGTELEAGQNAAVGQTALNLAAAKGNPLMLELINGMKALTNEVSALKRDKANEAKENFNAEIKALCAAGLPAADGQHFMSLGAKFGYDPALLQTAKKMVRLPVNGTARKTLANAAGPETLSTGDEPARDSDEAVKARLKARGIDPEKHYPRVANRG